MTTRYSPSFFLVVAALLFSTHKTAASSLRGNQKESSQLLSYGPLPFSLGQLPLEHRSLQTSSNPMCGQQISDSVVTLNEDIVCADQNGLSMIQGGTLDCNGHTIRGGDQGIGVQCLSGNCIIRNCVIDGFYIGFVGGAGSTDANDSNNHYTVQAVLEDVQIIRSRGIGIAVADSSPLTGDFTLTLRRNTSVRNANAGIQFSNLYKFFLEDATFCDNVAYDIGSHDATAPDGGEGCGDCIPTERARLVYDTCEPNDPTCDTYFKRFRSGFCSI